MKDILSYYADCNKKINEAMNDVITRNIPKPYGLALEGYFFKSLKELLEHIFVSDMMWMGAFMDVDNYGLDIVKEVREMPKFGEAVFATYDEYKSGRSLLDEFIIRYMSSIDEQILTRNVKRANKSGGVIEKEIKKSFIHFFNHQTHHRGQISNILDNLNIENNYSNMIYY
jgi:uncharacterized damage-inducible protein DinB